MATPTDSTKRSFHGRIVVFILASWTGAAAVAATGTTGLEFLEPQDVAYVEVRGIVVDGTTGTPIKGATVLAVWKGATYGFHGTSHHDCLRVDATTTQADGHFSLKTSPKNVYRKGMAQQDVDIRIHAPGMQEMAQGGTGRKMQWLPDQRPLLGKLIPPRQAGVDVTVPMVPSRQDLPDRIRALELSGQQPMDCESMGDPAAVQGYFAALAAEARAIAKTRYQKAVAEALASGAATAASALGTEQKSSDRIMASVYLGPELSDIERRDRGGATPLMGAAANGNLAEVRSLLERGANPNRTFGRAFSPWDGGTALTIAMSGYARFKGDKGTAAQYASMIQALLADSRTDANLRGAPDADTPLMIALRNLQDDVVEWLLAAGADPNLTASQGRVSTMGEALRALGKRRDGKTLAPARHQFELLIASGRTNLDLVMPGEGATPITSWLYQSDTYVVKKLLEAGANPNAQDALKRTPLTATVNYAILNPQRPVYLEAVRLIASWPGVDFNARYEGKTALQMAQSAGRAELAAILEKR